ncbi:hypothetical protein TraAM80_06717 [Trypanosoma rangeli]|uniref:Uncharacterized protein n=1 Tax=Trypanosoma rangeli TaxID=5698 RepID=A0A3S5IQR3_TRYRA|nr:uncharacterized protein TraAM80_06717 [Trypanosoma rangeli]RNF01876.1 hypothetical protein TraAM80_06717 [Trypanosoma rangeli]|eukprot:RNF01876.1 hypothetical protein TraAM80_06717 [Trypanosoma rangeli]
MECRFCFCAGEVGEAGRFKACGRCAARVVPFCEELVRQVDGVLANQSWSVEVVTDEKDWLLALASAVKEAELSDEGRRAIVFALRCRKGDITTFTFMDRMSVLAAASAAVARLLTSPKRAKPSVKQNQ